MTTPDNIHTAMHAIARSTPDYDAWRQRLIDNKIDYLMICPDMDKNPIEAVWAAARPALFHRVFETNSVSIYWVRRS